MPEAEDILDLAYRVRTSEIRFADVPEAQRRDVAAAMGRLSAAKLQLMAEARRFPRGGGFGVHHTSRVN